MPENNQSNAPWNIMFFFSHFIWPSMGEVEHVTLGSVLCQIAYGTVLWKLSLVDLWKQGCYSGESIQLPPMWTGSNPSLCTISGLSLLMVRSFAVKGFSLLSKNKHFQTPIRPMLSDHIQ